SRHFCPRRPSGRQRVDVKNPQAEGMQTGAQDLFSVRGRNALVVGGTRGIGRAIAWRLAQGGARVIANHVREQGPADELSREAAANGLALETVRADVTSTKGIDTLVESAARQLDPLSILVFAAATGVHKNFDQLTLRHWDWTFNLNVRAFF